LTPDVLAVARKGLRLDAYHALKNNSPNFEN